MTTYYVDPNQTFITGDLTLDEDIIVEEAIVDNTWEVGSIQVINVVNGSAEPATLTLDAGYSITLEDYPSLGTDYQAITGVGNATGISTINNYGTIDGGGTIGGYLIINNEAGGVIDATGVYGLALATYSIGPSNQYSHVVNQGVLEATGTGGLGIEGLVDNGGGLILANGAGAHVDLDPASYVYGGEFETENGGVIDVDYNTYIDGTNLTGQGSVTVAQGSTIDILGTWSWIATTAATDYISNQGLIEELYGAEIVISGYNTVGGTLNLSGGGTIVLAYCEDGSLDGDGQSILDNVDNTISGYGSISALDIINEAAGIIDANSSSQLAINGDYYGSTIANSGLVEATSTGGLLLYGGTIDNTDGGTLNTGVILANGAGAIVDLELTIIGGTLETETGGLLEASDATLDGLESGDPVNIVQGGALTAGYLTLEGTIENAGTIDIGSLTANSTGTLTINSSATLQGSGQVVVVQQPHGEESVNASGLDLQQELSGGGGTIYVIGASALTNESIINADGSLALTIEGNYPYQLSTISSTVENLGTLESTSGAGGLYLTDIIIDNTQNGDAGQIVAGTANGPSGAQVDLGAAYIEGGTLTSYSGDAIDVTGLGSVLDGTKAAVTISGGSDLVVDPYNLAIDGAIDNQGTISLPGALLVGANGNDADATATLSGGGTVLLGGGIANDAGYIDDNDTLDGTSITLDNIDNTISGSGWIEVDSFINETKGIVDATGAYQSGISSGSVTNQGILETTAGAGGLQLSYTTVQNDGGQIIADGAGTHVDLNSADIIGGTLSTSNGGVIQALGNPYFATETVIDGTSTPVTLTAGSELLDAPYATLDITGSFINDGTIVDDGDPPSAQPNVVVDNVSGTGNIGIEDSSTLEVTGSSGNGQTYTFENGPTTTSEALQIDSISIGSDLDFASTIAGMQNSDTINLTNFANPTGYNFDGTTLTVNFANGGNANLTLSGLAADTQFSFNPFGTAGTSITIADPSVPATFIVYNQAELNNAITGIEQQGTAGNYTIQFGGDIIEGQSGQPDGIYAISLPSDIDLTIDGAGDTLNGAGIDGGLAVLSGKVTIESLTIEDTVAQGQAGEQSGGGGAGLGGGLFVGSGASVALTNVSFQAELRAGGRRRTRRRRRGWRKLEPAGCSNRRAWRERQSWPRRNERE